MSESVWHVDGSEDNAIAVFKNPEGIVASYQTTWSEWKGYKSHVEVYGDNGMVRAAYAPMQNLLIANTTKGKLRKVRKFYPEIILREKLKGWQTTALLSFQEELADFVKMIGGDYRVPLADGHAGLRSIEVSEAVRLSSRTRPTRRTAQYREHVPVVVLVAGFGLQLRVAMRWPARAESAMIVRAGFWNGLVGKAALSVT